MQLMFLWKEELNSFYIEINAVKTICIDILSLAAEQIAQIAEDLIGSNAS